MIAWVFTILLIYKVAFCPLINIWGYEDLKKIKINLWMFSFLILLNFTRFLLTLQKVSITFGIVRQENKRNCLQSQEPVEVCLINLTTTQDCCINWEA